MAVDRFLTTNSFCIFLVFLKFVSLLLILPFYFKLFYFSFCHYVLHYNRRRHRLNDSAMYRRRWLLVAIELYVCHDESR